MASSHNAEYMSGKDLVEFFPGDDAGLRVNVFTKVDGVDTPYPLTGSEFMLLIKSDYRHKDEKSVIIERTGILEDNEAANGTIYFLIPNEKTANLEPGKYFVTIKRRLASAVCTVKRGKLSVLSPAACN